MRYIKNINEINTEFDDHKVGQNVNLSNMQPTIDLPTDYYITPDEDGDDEDEYYSTSAGKSGLYYGVEPGHNKGLKKRNTAPQKMSAEKLNVVIPYNSYIFENIGDINNKILSNIKYKIQNTKEGIEDELNLITNLEKTIIKKYILIYCSYTSPKINSEIKYEDFIKNYNIGKANLSFIDPYDSLLESYITIYDEYISWRRGDYNMLYITEYEYKRLKINEFNI